ncbi:hypothetical protein GCM10023177_44100 [Streptomyces violaceoruber]|nr:hypothetical protein JCM4020_32990 [Streptomyces coelicolor]
MPMARSQNKYADFEGLRERAVALRRAGYSLRQIRDELKVFNNDILSQLVKGEPPPEWTKRPRAKDDLRAKARELRLQGWTYDQIEAELGWAAPGVRCRCGCVTFRNPNLDTRHSAPRSKPSWPSENCQPANSSWWA